MGCGCGAGSGLLLRGGMAKAGGGLQRNTSQRGGGCPCALGGQVSGLHSAAKSKAIGGYKATARNLKALRKWKRGESIGFTMRSSLKAKGLIPRANGTCRVSPKYQTRRVTRRRRE